MAIPFSSKDTSEHETLSGPDSVMCVKCSVSIKPIITSREQKGIDRTRLEKLTKELNLDRSDFTFDRQPVVFEEEEKVFVVQGYRVKQGRAVIN